MWYLPRITNKRAQAFLLIAITTSFIGHNLPIIGENYILKQNSLILLQREAEERIANRHIPSQARVTQLGTSIESIRPDIGVVDFRSTFEIADPEKAYQVTKEAKIDYILFTDTVQNQEPSLDNAQGVSYYWRSLLDNTKFHLIDVEYFGPHAIYLITPRSDISAIDPIKFREYSANSATLEQDIVSAINNRPIRSWSVTIKDNQMHEVIHLPEEVIRINYPTTSLVTSGRIVTTYSPQLRPLRLRETLPQSIRWYTVEKSDAVMHLSGFTTAQRYIELSDYSRNTLRVTQSPKEWSNLTATFIPRGAYRFFLHLLVALGALIVFAVTTRSLASEPMPRLVLIAGAFLFLDLLFFSQLFFTYYTRLL